MSGSEVRRQAHLFAVETDAQILEARRSASDVVLSGAPSTAAPETSDFIIPLSDDAVWYLARAFFKDSYLSQTEKPDYVVGSHTKAYQDVLVDA